MDRSVDLRSCKPTLWQPALRHPLADLLLYRGIDRSAVCECSKGNGRCEKTCVDGKAEAYHLGLLKGLLMTSLHAPRRTGKRVLLPRLARKSAAPIAGKWVMPG